MSDSIVHIPFYRDICLSKTKSQKLTSIVCLGDFNDRYVKWTDNHSKSELNEQLKNAITDLALYQMVDEATRISDTTSYILDLLITDSLGYIK